MQEMLLAAVDELKTACIDSDALLRAAHGTIGGAFSLLDGARMAEILRQPEALEQGSKAMADYRAILEAEGMKRQVSDETDLLALRDRLRQKKSI